MSMLETKQTDSAIFGDRVDDIVFRREYDQIQ